MRYISLNVAMMGIVALFSPLARAQQAPSTSGCLEKLERGTRKYVNEFDQALPMLLNF
jgi:hypothetical protein